MTCNNQSILIKEKLPQNLILAATEARKLTETFANRHRNIGNPITLECYCAIGSYILWQVARKKYEIKSLSFCCGYFKENPRHYDFDLYENHCWTKYRNRYAVDITATQFSGIKEEVFVYELGDSNTLYSEISTGIAALSKVNDRWGNQGIRMHRKYLDNLLNQNLAFGEPR